MQTETEIRPYRPDIDGLRSVAILAVLLAHGGFLPFAGGDTALAAFFVISGYLLTEALVRSGGAISIGEFYDRRARRSLPTLIVATAATLLAGAVLQSPGEIAGLARAALGSVVLISNVALLDDSGAAPFLHTWSLSMAGQIFLALPIVAVLLARASGRVIVLFVVLATLASFVLGVADAPATVTVHVHHRLWQFGAGVLVALVPLGPPRRWLAGGLAGIGMAAVVLPVFISNPEISRTGAGALPTVVGTALVIWANRRETATRSILGAPPVVFLGVISYSLYVWHWPLLVFSRQIWGELGTAGTLGWLAVTVLVATLSWYFIEQPLRYPSGPLRSRAAMLAASLAGVASVAALAAVVASEGAVASRPGVSAAYASEGGLACPGCVGR
jgi:peptidoglycan/LPS O-acetylase OafA/YrhL